LARALAGRGRVSEAAAVYDKLLVTSPSVTARAPAGKFYAHHGKAEAAVAQGVAIRAESPRHPTGLFLLGEELLGDGKAEEALKAYRDALRLEEDAQVAEGLGRAAEQRGQLDEALRQYARAVELDAGYLRPRLGRARVRLLRREYALAIEELESARELAPEDPAVLRGLGQAHLTMRQVKLAVPLLERAVKVAPEDAEANFYLGSAYADLERSRDAARHLARAVAAAPVHAPWRADAYRTLGYAARAAKDKKAAMAAWRTYLELDQDDSPQRRDVQRLLLRLEAR
jgi:tetratricopeptide (TPR) repeat protein